MNGRMKSFLFAFGGHVKRFSADLQCGLIEVHSPIVLMDCWARGGSAGAARSSRRVLHDIPPELCTVQFSTKQLQLASREGFLLLNHWMRPPVRARGDVTPDSALFPTNEEGEPLFPCYIPLHTLVEAWGVRSSVEDTLPRAKCVLVPPVVAAGASHFHPSRGSVSLLDKEEYRAWFEHYSRICAAVKGTPSGKEPCRVPDELTADVLNRADAIDVNF